MRHWEISETKRGMTVTQIAIRFNLLGLAMPPPFAPFEQPLLADLGRSV
jgi:hypothetical protein